MKKVMTLQVPVKAVDGEEGVLDQTTLGSIDLVLRYVQSSDTLIMNDLRWARKFYETFLANPSADREKSRRTSAMIRTSDI